MCCYVSSLLLNLKALKSIVKIAFKNENISVLTADFRDYNLEIIHVYFFCNQYLINRC